MVMRKDLFLAQFLLKKMGKPQSAGGVSKKNQVKRNGATKHLSARALTFVGTFTEISIDIPMLIVLL